MISKQTYRLSFFNPFSFVFPALFPVILSLFLVGCSTMNINNSLSQQEPENHLIEANRYMKMANECHSASSYEYRLRATDHLLKAKHYDEAGKLLREIQNREKVDNYTHNQILETRLSVLKQDIHRAETLLAELLAPYGGHKPLQDGLAGTAKGQKIALLLPTKGQHAEAAKTIRDGFLAAYYKTLERRPTDPSVQVYDTGEGADVAAAYQKAIADHADFIVGPLTKAEVQAISGMQLDVPVLALNSIPVKRSTSSKLYQFGLMPEDEVVATVENANRRGHRRAMIIAPNTEWGNRMANTFQQLWSNQGGLVVGTIVLNNNQDIEAQLRAAAKPPRKLTRLGSKTQSPQSQPQSHHASNAQENTQFNTDMIFLAAPPELARQVTPLLSYLSAATPIYSTASIYSGTPSPKLDRDLDGIHFCDMPWVINNSNELQEVKAKFSELWPNSMNRAPRYFAMGMDAYTLANQLAATRFLPASGTHGMTGQLSIEGQRVQRKLVCVKFEQGVPVPD